jgi:hypothetical protein
MNNEKFEKLFEKWLWMSPEEKKRNNPFVEFMEGSLKSLPKVKLPKF